MSELVVLEHLTLAANSPSLSLVVSRGQSLAIAGPACSGKSAFLRILNSAGRPYSGSVAVTGRIGAAEPIANRRLKVSSLAKKVGLANTSTRVTELLMATRLWDKRQHTVADLTASELAAAELLEPLSQDPDLLLIDGQLDRLDPWALSGVMKHLSDMQSRGAAIVVATNRPDLIGQFDALVVLRDLFVKFAGMVGDLLRAGPSHQLVVATNNQPGVRAIVSPFQISMVEEGQSFKLSAKEGQELAAQLLLQGYGDVEYVILRQPTVEEALLRILE